MLSVCRSRRLDPSGAQSHAQSALWIGNRIQPSVLVKGLSEGQATEGRSSDACRGRVVSVSQHSLSEAFGEGADEFLGFIHEYVVIGAWQVPLEHGEFGLMEATALSIAPGRCDLMDGSRAGG